MKICLMILGFLACSLPASARSRIFSPAVKSLQVVVNQDWLSPPVMRMGTDDVLNVSFDELSHQYHRYIYRLEHCEADWTPSSDLFESDWLEGFNDNTIDDYENSINTTVSYTHYQFQLPNDRCRLKMSGNYRLHIIDEDQDGETVLTAEFMLSEQAMTLSLQATTNTDIDTNDSHQQLSMSLGYGNHIVTQPSEQIYTVVMQNGRDETARRNVRPSYVNANGLEWSHCRPLIFDAGNEYHKFEILDVTHPTLGIDAIRWDGAYFQAFPFTDTPRPNYLYDEDADGAFYLRNSDNRESETTSDYVWVNFTLQMLPIPQGSIIVDGQWATGDNPYDYVMTYDDIIAAYHAKVLLKLGYYNYQYLWLHDDGTTSLLPAEGSFYQTENRYQALVYYRPTGERTWRLMAWRQIQL